MIDTLDRELVPFDKKLRAYARKQAGCRALIDAIYGVGELTAVTILAELGDVRRFHNSRDVVRYAGLDITVYQSDNHRAPGHPFTPRPARVALDAIRGSPTRPVPSEPRPAVLPSAR